MTFSSYNIASSAEKKALSVSLHLNIPQGTRKKAIYVNIDVLSGTITWSQFYMFFVPFAKS